MTRCCRQCGSYDKPISLCGQCHHTTYCSKQCQKEDWNNHAYICAPQQQKPPKKISLSQKLENLHKKYKEMSSEFDVFDQMEKLQKSFPTTWAIYLKDILEKRTQRYIQLEFDVDMILKEVLMEAKASDRQIMVIESEMIKHKNLWKKVYLEDNADLDSVYVRIHNHHKNVWNFVYELVGLSTGQRFLDSQKEDQHFFYSMFAEVIYESVKKMTNEQAEIQQKKFVESSIDLVDGPMLDWLIFVKEKSKRFGVEYTAGIVRRIANCIIAASTSGKQPLISVYNRENNPDAEFLYTEEMKAIEEAAKTAESKTINPLTWTGIKIGDLADYIEKYALIKDDEYKDDPDKTDAENRKYYQLHTALRWAGFLITSGIIGYRYFINMHPNEEAERVVLENIDIAREGTRKSVEELREQQQKMRKENEERQQRNLEINMALESAPAFMLKYLAIPLDERIKLGLAERLQSQNCPIPEQWTTKEGLLEMQKVKIQAANYTLSTADSLFSKGSLSIIPTSNTTALDICKNYQTNRITNVFLRGINDLENGIKQGIFAPGGQTEMARYKIESLQQLEQKVQRVIELEPSPEAKVLLEYRVYNDLESGLLKKIYEQQLKMDAEKFQEELLKEKARSEAMHKAWAMEMDILNKEIDDVTEKLNSHVERFVKVEQILNDTKSDVTKISTAPKNPVEQLYQDLSDLSEPTSAGWVGIPKTDIGLNLPNPLHGLHYFRIWDFTKPVVTEMWKTLRTSVSVLLSKNPNMGWLQMFYELGNASITAIKIIFALQIVLFIIQHILGFIANPIIALLELIETSFKKMDGEFNSSWGKMSKGIGKGGALAFGIIKWIVKTTTGTTQKLAGLLSGLAPIFFGLSGMVVNLLAFLYILFGYAPLGEGVLTGWGAFTNFISSLLFFAYSAHTLFPPSSSALFNCFALFLKVGGHIGNIASYFGDMDIIEKINFGQVLETFTRFKQNPMTFGKK